MAGTVRILSIDGGGMRGYMGASFLKRFCEDADIDSSQLYKHFDIIAGTSIGGIQALGYAYGLSPDDILELMSEKGDDIFDPGIFTLPYYKERVVMGLSTSSYIYDNTQITSAVQSVIPPLTKLSDLPGNVIIPAWNRTTNLPTFFSNMRGYDFLSGSDELVSDVATATSSAPIYFQESTFSGNVYADGGVIQNNPTLIAYHAAQNVFPSVNRYCILSLGAGATYADVLAPSVPSTPLLLASNNATSQEKEEIRQEFVAFKENVQNKYPHLALDSLSDDLFASTLVPARVQDLFYYMQNVFIGGVQQLVDDLMVFTTKNPYKNISYYRFQKKFESYEQSALDETDPLYLSFLQGYANYIYDHDALAIANFIQHFKV